MTNTNESPRRNFVRVKDLQASVASKRASGGGEAGRFAGSNTFDVEAAPG